MRINVNGEEISLQEIKECLKLYQLLDYLGYEKKTIIVELNKLIISSDEWENETVKEGDKLEIVSIVGGG